MLSLPYEYVGERVARLGIWRKMANMGQTKKAMAALAREIQALYKSEPLRGLFQTWGRQGGRKRTKRLTAEERRKIARKAALARWRRRRSGSS